MRLPNHERHYPFGSFVPGSKISSYPTCQSRTCEESFDPEKKYDKIIPKQVQKLEFCQSGRSRFNPIEAAPIQVDRCDAEGVKGGDAHEGKNQLLNLFGYITPLMAR